MSNHYTTELYINDLPFNHKLSGDLAIDTEAMGLKIQRDRLCMIQISDNQGHVYLVHFPENKYDYSAPNLKKLLLDDVSQKIFHYGRFDIAIIKHYLNIEKITNIFCTKIASRLTRTYTDHHGLKSLVNDLLRLEMRKDYQSTNWGSESISEGQKNYAANDVIYLHRLRDKLISLLKFNGRLQICLDYCNFLDNITASDLLGFEEDLYRHS